MRRIPLFLLWLVFLVAFYSKVESSCPDTLDKASDFSLQNLEGAEVKLSDFNGKSIILFFWATWCSKCKGHIPEFNKIYPLLKEKEIEFLAIGVGETQKRVEKLTRKMPMDFPVLLDNDEKISQAYLVLGVPTFVIINKAGDIKFHSNFWPSNYEKYICE